MKKVINKGYTLTVDSYENDGDNSRTMSMTVDTKEEAQAIHLMCTTLFQSKNSNYNGNEIGIGNMMKEDYDEALEFIIPFMKEHPILLEKYKDDLDILDYENDDKLVEICREYNYDLMGGSEWYFSRVCESCTVTYSAEDVFLEEINF